MTAGVDIARTAALIGDPGRSNMLALLIDGRAHTASELAAAAGVTRATASGHLARLQAGELVAAARQGRHRYFRLASAEVATLLEGLMAVSVTATTATVARASPRVPPRLREARVCYDHMAGRVGVAIADGFIRLGAVRIDGDHAELTAAGRALLERLGAGSALETESRRPTCRLCLDWSERRPHLAGKLGAELLDHALEQRWVRRVSGGRELCVTPSGAVALRTWLDVDAVAEG